MDSLKMFKASFGPKKNGNRFSSLYFFSYIQHKKFLRSTSKFSIAFTYGYMWVVVLFLMVTHGLWYFFLWLLMGCGTFSYGYLWVVVTFSYGYLWVVVPFLSHWILNFVFIFMCIMQQGIGLVKTIRGILGFFYVYRQRNL